MYNYIKTITKAIDSEWFINLLGSKKKLEELVLLSGIEINDVFDISSDSYPTPQVSDKLRFRVHRVKTVWVKDQWRTVPKEVDEYTYDTAIDKPVQLLRAMLNMKAPWLNNYELNIYKDSNLFFVKFDKNFSLYLSVSSILSNPKTICIDILEGYKNQKEYKRKSISVFTIQRAFYKFIKSELYLKLKNYPKL